MAEDLYDPYIDFGFDDEANYVAPSEDVLSLPASLAAIFEALRPGLPLPQAEEPTTSPPVPDPLYAFPSHNTPTFYQYSPVPSCSLGNTLDEVYPATCVCPSDTIYTHGASSTTPLPPAPSPHQYMPSVGSPCPSRVKRLRECSEDFSCPEQSLWRKRQRTAPLGTSVAHIGHSFSSINDPSPVAEVTDGAVSGEPVIHSPRTWGRLPQPEDNSIGGPSTLNVENALCPRISQKRTWHDENRDRSATSNKRHKRAALANVPEVLNAPVVPYYDSSPEGSPYATSAAPGSRFTGFPELSPEFYSELCEIAFEIAQDLKQTFNNTDQASTYQNLPESSTTAYSAGEDSYNRPAPTTTGKRLRNQASPELEPPTKRQRTSSPPNTDVPSLATCPQTETSTSQKPFGCPFADDPTPCLQRFTRETDVNRHIRSKHLGVSVFCISPAHAEPMHVVREDGVFRHLGFNSCIGVAARAELVAQCAREMAGAKGKNTSSRHWRAKVHKAVSRMFARVHMPCYFRDARFWEALGYLHGWTPYRLEEWFSAYGEVQRCECEYCKNISDAELRGKVKIEVQHGPWNMQPRPSSSVGPMIAGPSSAGAAAPTPSLPTFSDAVAILNDGDCDDKLPPEEEEGVDEDLPQVSPPAVAVVAQDDDATPIAMGDLSEAPDLQTVCDILSRLSDEVLGTILRRSPYGGQRKVDPTPNGKADA